jgi:hypothetical protein
MKDAQRKRICVGLVAAATGDVRISYSCIISAVLIERHAMHVAVTVIDRTELELFEYSSILLV